VGRFSSKYTLLAGLTLILALRVTMPALNSFAASSHISSRSFLVGELQPGFEGWSHSSYIAAYFFFHHAISSFTQAPLFHPTNNPCRSLTNSTSGATTGPAYFFPLIAFSGRIFISTFLSVQSELFISPRDCFN